METARREIATVERQIRAIIEAVKQGFASSILREELDLLERRKAELSRSAARPAPVPVLHPNLAELYRRMVAGLREALSDEATREEAADVLRSLVAEARPVPVDGVLTIRLRGELASCSKPQTKNPAGGRGLSICKQSWLRGLETPES
jgi:site-specific DNA recombinase